MLAFLTAFADTADPAAGVPLGGIYQYLMLGLIVVVFYFFIIRPQKKKEKETKSMLEAIKTGDKVTTIGGIVGKVTKVKEKEITIETGIGNEKNVLVLAKWAVQSIDKPSNEKAPEETEEKALEGEVE